jgi:ribosome assembly protein RRB1
MDIDGEEDALSVVGEEEEDGEDPSASAQQEEIFIAGKHTLEKDEVLEADQSVYEMLHRMNVTWPCLSFDVLRDRLGDGRKKYPATTYVVTGTQADTASNNEVLVMKMSQLHRTQKDDGKL